jgi:hypothetical protein
VSQHSLVDEAAVAQFAPLKTDGSTASLAFHCQESRLPVVSGECLTAPSFMVNVKCCIAQNKGAASSLIFCEELTEAGAIYGC